MEKKSYHSRKWQQLSDLKAYIDSNVKKEKVISFDGWKLVTNKYEYTMFLGELIRRERK